MISVDTGPAHAAAALGLPLVVMFGAGAQRYWLPRSSSSSPVIGVGGKPASVRVDQIPVDAVFHAWCALRAQMESAPRRPQTNAPAFQPEPPLPDTGTARPLREGAQA
jgi:heptosyltransferase-2/heptosyltransferase-3